MAYHLSTVIPSHSPSTSIGLDGRAPVRTADLLLQYYVYA